MRDAVDNYRDVVDLVPVEQSNKAGGEESLHARALA